VWAWPNLQLTDYERKFVRVYKTAQYPGVLRRIYKVFLFQRGEVADIAGFTRPQNALSGQIQIARRSRIFGLLFSGNLDSWRLQITNASGTLYTVRDPRQQQDPIVSSMAPSSLFNAVSLGGVAPPLDAGAPVISPGIGPNGITSRVQAPVQMPAPLIIDPNWVLLPNETLIFNGTPVQVNYQGTDPDQEMTPDLALTISIHVWEFPRMGVASPEEREVV
jgi:hypothetical protein